ncbi:hypothetical protein FBZ90_12539 [Nitrospirillum pindoramense]|uniref:Uncharacterized protein n=1 Tax=Nitrospirillum amazonense TaxID=28077 RepID=A0A560GLI0_9PROT|nr:hypothetical protein FBZ90_12539 [Nitrospirillum amazonense]
MRDNTVWLEECLRASRAGRRISISRVEKRQDKAFALSIQARGYEQWPARTILAPCAADKNGD